MYNAVKMEPLAVRDMVVVSDSGSVVWVPPYKITSTCKLDTTWFPFDEQSCDLKMGSWVYDGLKLNLNLVMQLSGNES